MGNKQKSSIWTRGFICVLMSNICMSMAQFSVNTYASTYMDFLGMQTIVIGFVAGLYYFVAFALRPISGPMITRLNRKALMLACYSLGFFVNLGYALFSAIGMFIAVRFVHGIQLAFYGSLAMTVAADSLPEEKLATGLGVYGLSGIFAQALGPSLAAFARSFGEAQTGGKGGGFSAIFFMAAIFALLSVIPCAFLPNQEVSKQDKSQLGAWYKSIIAKEALMPAIVIMLLAMCSSLYGTYMVQYGEKANITGISLFFTVQAAFTLISRPMAGKLSDKFGYSKVFFPGLAIYSVSFLLVGLANGLFMVCAGAMFSALGMGSINPALQAMAIQSVEPRRRGVASNTTFFGTDLGMFFGPSIAGIVLAKFGFNIMYLYAFIPLALACAAFAVGWKPYKENKARLDSESANLGGNA